MPPQPKPRRQLGWVGVVRPGARARARAAGASMPHRGRSARRAGARARVWKQRAMPLHRPLGRGDVDAASRSGDEEIAILEARAPSGLSAVYSCAHRSITAVTLHTAGMVAWLPDRKRRGPRVSPGALRGLCAEARDEPQHAHYRVVMSSGPWPPEHREQLGPLLGGHQRLFMQRPRMSRPAVRPRASFRSEGGGHR
jgi:hypothetical protein